ncbi:MAG: phosphoribosylformylglycinamidine cyclo-ligase [Bdellovibrionales bacterium]|nr:phosphoribosylformylglycinamidine cyclo-ligase [Bdellovibrionales bacterium]
MALDYKQAGVDIEAGESLVSWLKEQQPRPMPFQERLVGGIGGFAALFRANFPEMKSPCLVSATDGIGTKLKLAIDFESYQGVGQDLVAMCVNDLICCGATPLFFLDYYACGKLRLPAAKEFLSGVLKACTESGCALIGGETAEMPGVYSHNDFDAAGFAVGVVDEAKTLGAHRVNVGDTLVAIESSGFHSNGYSLLRKVFAEDQESWKEELLIPTHLYVSAVKQVLESQNTALHAVAHITGGGLDNLLRVVPTGCQLQLHEWKIPEPFLEVERRTGLPRRELLKTLNCGVGMVLFVDSDASDSVIEIIQKQGFQSWVLGSVVEGKKEALSRWDFKKA